MTATPDKKELYGMNDENIKIISNSSSDKTLDNIERKEMLWDSNNEAILYKWMKNIKCNVSGHCRKGKHYKRLYYGLSIPGIIIPLTLSNINNLLSNDVMSILLLTSSAVNALGTFFNFSKKQSSHFEYESKYQELYNTIEMELVKHKADRIACDVFLERVLNKINHLDGGAPHL